MSPEPTRYSWSVFCAWGLTLSVAALTIAGVLAMFLELDAAAQADTRTFCVVAFAGVAGFALCNANNAAAAAMHAISKGETDWPTLGPSLFCTAGFCAVSVVGVHLGWEIIAAGVGPGHKLPDVILVDLAGLYLAIAKPAMSWVIQGRRALDRRPTSEKTLPVSDKETPAAHVAQEPEATPPAPVRSRPKLVETAVKVGVGIAVGTGPAMATAAEHTITEPAADKAVIEMQAREAIIGGVIGRNALQRAVPGLTKMHAAQLLDELAPGWRNRATG